MNKGKDSRIQSLECSPLQQLIWRLPSPLGGEGGNERINSIKFNLIKVKSQYGNEFLKDLTLRVHPLPNPSPVKGEGLSKLLRRRLKVNGAVVIACL
jgi:hypothetical protein